MIRSKIVATAGLVVALSAPASAAAPSFGLVMRVADVRLQPNEFCAGSPLTIGAQIENSGTVEDIHVVVNPHDLAVGWIYESSHGQSYLQANRRMTAADQQALKLSAGEAVSELRPKPNGLPIDLNVRGCLPAEISTF
jgi:hypothetical protein